MGVNATGKVVSFPTPAPSPSTHTALSPPPLEKFSDIDLAAQEAGEKYQPVVIPPPRIEVRHVTASTVGAKQAICTRLLLQLQQTIGTSLTWRTELTKD